MAIRYTNCYKMRNNIDKKKQAKYLKDKFGDKAIEVVYEIMDYITDCEPDYTGKTIWLQELQNEIRFLQLKAKKRF